MIETIPVLDAYRQGVHLIVWCTHCRLWHHHGVCGGGGGACRSWVTGRCRCPQGSADGHRVAHCGSDCSPYANSGYTLREVGRLTSHVKAQHREEMRARQRTLHRTGYERGCVCADPRPTR